MKVFSARLWRGLTGVFAVLFALILGGTSIANANASFLNNKLGTTNYVSETVEEDSNIDSYYFKSEFENVGDLYKAKVKLAAEIASEGSVLLKNANNGLPVDKTSEKVTLWGLNSRLPSQGGMIGSQATVGANTTQVNYDLETALSERKFNVNETMKSFYREDSVWAYHRKGGFGNDGFGLSPSFGMMWENPASYQVGEAPASLYTNDVLKSADGTVALVVISRGSSEAADFHPDMKNGSQDDEFTSGPLALSKNERDMLNLAKQHSSRVVVLINSDSAMEIEELKNDAEVDSILWVGAPGVNGFLGVADVISGDVNPSGSLPDTYAVQSEYSPAMQNFGVHMYTNNSKTGAAQGGIAKLTEANKADWYLVESEGIYVGYKYYETRYADTVNGNLNNNAASQSGSSRSGQSWEYGKEVSYPFGYGLSYSSFEFELTDVQFVIGGANRATVKVTNTGDLDGKTAVQLYVQTPYTKGGLEKSAIQLAGFTKTDLIKKGASATVTVEFDPALFASYDESEGDGAWVLDAGEYTFAVGNGAHAALNNVLRLQGKEENALTKTADSDVIAAAAAKTVKLNTKDTTTYSHNVKNALQDSDLNKLIPGSVEYFTRADWSKGWKTVENLTPTADMMKNLTNNVHSFTENDNEGVAVQWGQTNNLVLASMLTFDDNGKMTGVLPFEDLNWQKLVEQVSLEDAMNFIENGGQGFDPITNIGLGTTVYNHDGPIGIVQDQVAGYTTRWTEANKDEATYVAPDSEYALYSMASMPTEPVVAATFNVALVERQGELMGEDALWSNVNSIFGPGLNLHRVPYNGRNHEYYSEDSVLTNILGVAVCKGGKSKGCMMEPKHFALNHQESNRSGTSTFVTEQAARENELRGFQGAMSTNYAQGLMTAFNRVGTAFAGAHSGVNVQILRNEWGYKGWIVSDMVNGADYMNWRDNVLGGGGFLLSDKTFEKPGTAIGTMASHRSEIDKDMNFQYELQLAVKYHLYSIANSNYMNYLTSNTVFRYVRTWWQNSLIAADVVLGVLAGGAAAMYVLSVTVFRKEG